MDAERKEARTGVAPAAAVTVALLVVELALIFAVYALFHAVGGPWAGGIAAFVVEIAILSFATVSGYPPGANRHFVAFFALTVLFSALVPLAYLNWRWVRAGPLT